ncbi:NUDIX domain-containing protein [Streptosporangium lutulentum]
MAAGALIRDAVGAVLLVDPTYKPQWEVPGGSVDAGESPLAACRARWSKSSAWTGRWGACWRSIGYRPGPAGRTG